MLNMRRNSNGCFSNAMRLAGVAAACLLLAVPPATAGEPPAKAEQIKTHLEFLGYQVTIRADRLSVKHATKSDLSITKMADGMLLASYMKAKKVDRLALLELLNGLNTEAGVLRIYVDKDGDVAFEASTVEYDKAGFASFMSLWEKETGKLIPKYSAAMDKLAEAK